MEEIKDIINAFGNDIQKIILSNKNNKSCEYKKIDIRKINEGKKIIYQISRYTEKQVFQSNVNFVELGAELLKDYPNNFAQMNVFYEGYEMAYKVTKSGKLLKYKNINVQAKKNETKEHNRKKNYLIEEGQVIAPLVDMGIFTKDGKVVKTMYDKYKQINRFIEILDDVIKNDTREEINIIDFGCGKSYLTFIIYYYLVELKHKKVNIVGLDLKADVIKKCNEAAKRYRYDNLKFELGDINGYESDMRVDMVVTLHACDTATDYALYNALNWNAKYILSVPCCQHEVNKQIQNDILSPMLGYGIIKERMSALVTDTIRGKILESKGYKTQLMEFVDFDSSPKNILIRAVKTNVSTEKKTSSYREAVELCEFLNIKPTMMELIKK